MRLEFVGSFAKGELQLDDSEVVGIVGRSGSGKTTLIREAMGVLPGGRFLVDGRATEAPLPRDLLSAVFQDPNVQMMGGSCEEEIELLSQDHPVNEALAKAIMGREYSKDFFKLSDGYKKRAVIASVLSSEPKFVLMDEPLSNLDGQAVGELSALVRKGTLLAEHRVSWLRERVDRAYLIKDRRISEISVDKLYDDRFLREEGLRGFPVELPRSEMGKQVLDLDLGFRLRVRRGELLCLYGENGSGKTTAIRRLADAGKAYAIFQNPDLQFFKKTVAEEVGDEDLLRLFELKEKADSSPFALSFGEKMRVLIAAAVASGKEVVALDEPTTGMDGRALLSFLSAVDRLRQEGRGVVVATHDADLLKVCDTVIRLPMAVEV